MDPFVLAFFFVCSRGEKGVENEVCFQNLRKARSKVDRVKVKHNRFTFQELRFSYCLKNPVK